MKTLITNSYLLFIFIMLFIIGCDDIIEQDISNEVVHVVSPADSTITDRNNINFYWDPVPGANQYLFQMVTPSFEDAESMIVDSLLTNNKISLELDSGLYMWRISAENGYYLTDFFVSTLWIVGSKNLGDTKLDLIYPPNDASINDTTVTFEWEEIIDAEKYIIEIVDQDTFEIIKREAKHEYSFEQSDRAITWNVTALNEQSLTKSDSYTIQLDFTSPTSPSLVFPQNNLIITEVPINFEWTRNDDDVIADSLYIFNSNDQLIDNFPKRVETSEYQLNQLPSIGNYSWGVKSIDKAGNISESFSELRQFTYQ